MAETGSEKDHPGVVAPPPLIFLGGLVAGLAIDWLFAGPGFGLRGDLQWGLGLLLCIAGMALILIAGGQFRFARTNVEPWKPTTAIVKSGVYAFSRNPIYLGMALIFGGLSVMADSVVALAMLPVVLVIVHYGVITREERYLEIKFGDAYREYRRSVRRWL
jgi:protein-S-isoprenylcysteine O-methyltransferase Ste14